MKSSFIYFVDDTKTSFVLNDLKQIANKYDRVILLSTESIFNINELPKNIVVFDNFINWKNLNIKMVFLRNFFAILLIYFKEFLASKKIHPVKKSIALLCSNFYKASECFRILKTINDLDFKLAPFYAFWFYDCIYLARLKQLGIVNKVYIRAHGGDLFEERSSLIGKPLFRHYQFKYINKVFSVSETGTNYLKKKYPFYKNKIDTIYLGSQNHHHINKLNSNDFTIVSCAKVRDIKRIHLIAEALLLLDFKCIWFHIGNENLYATNDRTIPVYKRAKEALKTNNNITFIPLGEISNERIFKFYNEIPVNAFISVSASEGIPVSMMEAISFGIPVISTNVGGCHEIVRENSGLLIDANPELGTIIAALQKFKNSEMNSDDYRLCVKKFWGDRFDVKKNYSTFFELLN